MTYNKLKVNDKETEEIIDRDRGKEKNMEEGRVATERAEGEGKKRYGGRENDDREDGGRGKEKIWRKGG